MRQGPKYVFYQGYQMQKLVRRTESYYFNSGCFQKAEPLEKR